MWPSSAARRNLPISHWGACVSWRTVRESCGGAVFDECRLEKVAFSRCDLTQGEFRGTRLRGLSFADSDIRGIRVGEVDSFELKGLKINALQAVDLVRLLGVEVEE